MHVIRPPGMGNPRAPGDAGGRVPESPRVPRAPPRARPRDARSPASRIAQRVTDIPDPTKDLYPAKRNEKYGIGDRPITPEEINGNYNNFYEFGTAKNVAKAAQALKIRPWTVKIDGMVEKPFEIAIDDLIRKMPLEERLYRHRCVEAWSMTIPWTGFPLAKLVELAKPLSSAKYVEMQTFQDKTAPGLPPVLVSVALHRRADDRGGQQRTGVPRHRHVRQARAEADGRAAAPRGAVEVRLQVDQVDRALQLHRPAAEDVLGRPAGRRIRLLGQRQSGGAASALEPGERGRHRHQGAPADA